MEKTMQNITRRAALSGIASVSAIGGAGAALATVGHGTPPVSVNQPIGPLSPEQVNSRITELADELAVLLPSHPIQEIGSGIWEISVYPRNGFWRFRQMPGNYYREPLVKAIDAYREGAEKFDRHQLEDQDEIDAYADVTYAPPLEVLDTWDRPAVTREGAIAALWFVVKEAEDFSQSNGVTAMVKAALGYLESEQPA
jgi:hypothetical protein